MTSFDRDLTLRVRYNPEKLRGQSPEAAHLDLFNASQLSWQALPDVVEPLNDTIRAPLRSLPAGALFAPRYPPQTIYLPLMSH